MGQGHGHDVQLAKLSKYVRHPTEECSSNKDGPNNALLSARKPAARDR